jgi:predicted nucleotidyltransferase
MIYTIEELRERVRPVAEKYGLPAVYLFGSYARGEATEDSDVDLLVDTEGAKLSSPSSIFILFDDFEQAVKKRVDMIETNTLFSKNFISENPWFIGNVRNDVRKLV